MSAALGPQTYQPQAQPQGVVQQVQQYGQEAWQGVKSAFGYGQPQQPYGQQPYGYGQDPTAMYQQGQVQGAVDKGAYQGGAGYAQGYQQYQQPYGVQQPYGAQEPLPPQQASMIPSGGGALPWVVGGLAVLLIGGTLVGFMAMSKKGD